MTLMVDCNFTANVSVELQAASLDGSESRKEKRKGNMIVFQPGSHIAHHVTLCHFYALLAPGLPFHTRISEKIHY